MCLFTGWVELLITQDNALFAEACTQLIDSGIAYKEKIQNIGHGNRKMGQIGSLGENVRYANMYQIYVKKTDFAQAKAAVFRK